MAFLSLISKVFGLGRRFNGTPEQYLAMVQYMAYKNNPDYSTAELLQWGEVMQKVMKVNLRPYQNFEDLAEMVRRIILWLRKYTIRFRRYTSAVN